MQLDLTYPAPDDAQTILDIVKRHQGRASAISAAALAELSGIPQRRIRSIVRRLRVEFHQPIGSTPTEPAGYYFCVSQDELMEFTQTWWDFGIQQLVMVSKLRRFPPDEFLNQIRLSLSSESSGAGVPARQSSSGVGVPTRQSSSGVGVPPAQCHSHASGNPGF